MSLNIIVRAADTDIAVILLLHVHRFKATLLMDVGTNEKNNRHYINISGIAKPLSSEFCAALPSFHAFMRCDYISAFVRKGKVRPLSLLERNPQAQHAFANLVIAEQLSDGILNIVEAFTCSMYGAKKIQSSVNKPGYQIIERAFFSFFLMNGNTEQAQCAPSRVCIP